MLMKKSLLALLPRALATGMLLSVMLSLGSGCVVRPLGWRRGGGGRGHHHHHHRGW